MSAGKLRDFLMGQFERSWRFCILGRKEPPNICRALILLQQLRYGTMNEAEHHVRDAIVIAPSPFCRKIEQFQS